MNYSFNERRFEKQIEEATEVIKTILNNTRDPLCPHNVSHSYDDKYTLAEFLSNTALASTLTSLEVLGLNGESIQKLKAWSKDRSITLRFTAEYVSLFFSYFFLILFFSSFPSFVFSHFFLSFYSFPPFLYFSLFLLLPFFSPSFTLVFSFSYFVKKGKNVNSTEK